MVDVLITLGVIKLPLGVVVIVVPGEVVTINPVAGIVPLGA